MPAVHGAWETGKMAPPLFESGEGEDGSPPYGATCELGGEGGN